MRHRLRRTDKVRPQGRAHLCKGSLRSPLRASGSWRPLNPAQTACARNIGVMPPFGLPLPESACAQLVGVMPPSGLPLPESARAWIAGCAPSPQPPAPRTRAASRRDPIASAVSTSAPPVARGRAARAWGHGLARACSACAALSVPLARHALHTVPPIAPLGRSCAPHALRIRR